MAKLSFRFGTMGSGKSLELIKIKTNYDIQGKNCIILTSSLDTRSGLSEVSSRNGQKEKAIYIDEDTYFDIANMKENEPIHCILVDEAQFLTKEDVLMLGDVVDDLGIPVICFGLRTDFSGNLFDGSKALIEYADDIQELVTECFNCDKKSILNLRLVNGRAVYTGEQIQIGDSEYLPLCRYCFKHFNELGNTRNTEQYNPELEHEGHNHGF